MRLAVGVLDSGARRHIMAAAVNIILFEPHELGVPLPRADRRAQHVLDVLRRPVGGTFDAGVVNGPAGKATITAIIDGAISFRFVATLPPSAAAAITLVVGMPRPQTARDILRDATTLGVGAIHFVRTEKSESSYGQSTLWSSGEWRRHAITGAEQAFDTRVPEITFGGTFRELIARLATDPARATERRIALDNYESPASLAGVPIEPGAAVVLAIGSERGWTTAEREQLRQSRFTFAHLGTRVLRTETAVVSALTLLHAKLRLME